VRVNTGVKRARWSEHAHAFAEVELARGAAGGVEIRLARSGNVSGVVRHADGTPAQASLFFVGDDGHADKGWSSDESGSFSLTRVAPGRLRLFARTPTSVSAWSEPVEVESGASASVDLVLQPAATLSIELSSGGVRPDEARVDVRDADGRDMSAFEDSAIAGCLSVAKGRATIGPLPSGRYTLRAGDSSQRRATAELSIAGDGPQRVALELTR
jgi:hypothetical protein